jgi:hypothetical protein
MMTYRLLALSLLALLSMSSASRAQTVQLTTMNGEMLEASALQLTAEGATLTREGEPEKVILLADVAKIQWSSEPVPAVEQPPLSIQLVDGSSLLAAQCVVSEGTAEINLITGKQVSVSTRNIQWIRFQPTPAGSELEKQWNEIVEEAETGDLLIVRREVDGESSLSGVEGVLGPLSAESLSFKFDDSEVEVERGRIDTMIYYHPAGRSLPEVQAKLIDRFGEVLYLRDWQASDDSITAKTLANAEVTVSLADIREFDFEVGRVLHLSDLEPSTFEWTPFISGGVESGNLQSLFAIAKNQAFSGSPLSLYSNSGFGAGPSVTRQFTRGMALRSQTRLIYRIPDGFTRLVGWVGIDPAVRPRGNIKLLIEGDGKALFTTDVTGADPEPIELSLDIEGVRRLSVRVLFGEAGDLGDRVHLCELRAVK